MRNYKKLKKILQYKKLLQKYLTKEKQKEAGKVKWATETTPVKEMPIESNVRKIKSLSDTTLYAPALNKQNSFYWSHTRQSLLAKNACAIK